ncbi:MAG: hypothetical protein JZD41_01755 [Thermoproteus sp.]|nr:hypothetical protein [Thermoproteus sp.]
MDGNERKIKLAINGIEIEQMIKDKRVELVIDAQGAHITLIIETREAQGGQSGIEMGKIKEQDRRKKKKKVSDRDVVEYGEPIEYKANGVEVKITPARPKEVEVTPITQESLEEIWSKYKNGEYTHLRLIVNGEQYDLVADAKKQVRVVFVISGKNALKLAKALGQEGKLTSGGFFRFGRSYLAELLRKGVKAYAVRRAKMGDAMWPVEIIYKGRKIMLEMSYHNYHLMKDSNNGVIDVIECDGSGCKNAGIGLELLADIKTGTSSCAECREKWLAEALNAAGLKWYVRGDRLYVHLPAKQLFFD